MPLRTALARCPEAVFLPADNPTYEAASAQVMAVLRSIGGVVVEVLGWDEAFVGATVEGPADAEALAGRIQEAVWARTRLSCAVGIGDNLLRAKIATEFGKPGGRFTLTAENWSEVMGHRPTRALWGIGAKTAAKLAERGLHTVAELGAADPEALAADLGPAMGPWYVQLGRGLGRVEVRGEPWVARSHGREETFPADLTDWADVQAATAVLARRVAQDVVAEGRPRRAGRGHRPVRPVHHAVPQHDARRADVRRREAASRGPGGVGAVQPRSSGPPRRGAGGVRELSGALSHAAASSTVSTMGTPEGDGGRSISTTGSPSSLAATSFAAVRSPPLSRQTSTSMRCSRSSARSASAVNGPRSSTIRCRAGSGPAGGSMARRRNHPGRSAKAASPPDPIAKNARSPRLGSSAAAAAKSRTRCQRSPGPAVQPGLRSASRGMSSAPAAVIAGRGHPRRERVGGVDHRGRPVVAQPRDQPVDPAEPADPHVALRQERGRRPRLPATR